MVSLNKALLSPYFWDGYVRGGVGWLAMNVNLTNIETSTVGLPYLFTVYFSIRLFIPCNPHLNKKPCEKPCWLHTAVDGSYIPADIYSSIINLKCRYLAGFLRQKKPTSSGHALASWMPWWTLRVPWLMMLDQDRCWSIYWMYWCMDISPVNISELCCLKMYLDPNCVCDQVLIEISLILSTILTSCCLIPPK